MLRKRINAAFVLKLAGAVLTGYMLACSFPLPFVLRGMEGAGAAWMGLIPLMLVVRNSRPKEAFGWGCFSGFLFWMVSLAWLLQLRHTWGNLPLSVLAWIGLSLYCALYTGFFAFLLAALPSGKTPDSEETGFGWRLLPLVAAPVFWVGTEVLRTTLFTGFSWNMLGVSQYRNIAAIQIADVGGVYAVSGLVVFLNAALAMTVYRLCREARHRPRKRRLHVELMAGLVVVALCWSWGVRTVRQAPAVDGTPLRIAAIQPAIPQVQKWTEESEHDIYSALHEQTTLALMSRPDLVVWPETATPGMLRIDPSTQRLIATLTGEGAFLLVGSMDYLQEAEEEPCYLNASFLVAPSGDIASVYFKRHLVPFGEYLPFENQISLIKRLAPLGFSCLAGLQQPLMTVLPRSAPEGARLAFSTLICFEDAFPYLARRDVRRGARLLINQTNDAWFDGSAASRQHLANAVFRAVENRVPLVRSANTGVTCFIDRFGRIIDQFCTSGGDTHMRGFAVSEVTMPGDTMSLRPYTRYGDWLFGWPCTMATILFAIWLPVRCRIAAKQIPA